MLLTYYGLTIIFFKTKQVSCFVELDFVFLLSYDKSSFAFFSQIANN